MGSGRQPLALTATPSPPLLALTATLPPPLQVPSLLLTTHCSPSADPGTRAACLAVLKGLASYPAGAAYLAEHCGAIAWACALAAAPLSAAAAASYYEKVPFRILL